MNDAFVQRMPLPEFRLWENKSSRTPFSFELEITARCNCNCRHCYINLPAGDRQAKKKELALQEIDGFADQAVDLGALWCLITGGEPLLRQDFSDIYLLLKRKGLLVSVFTNACLIDPEHVRLFQNYPPRDIEVTAYGVTPETYERVTRRQGSYAAFRRGLDLLQEAGVKVRLKAMALRSNVNEFHEIARFSRQFTSDYFRFDPLLHLRYDGNPVRNAEIRAERLSPDEIARLEQSDEERAIQLQKGCDQWITSEHSEKRCENIFHCGAGQNNFVVSYDGYFRLCSSLVRSDCSYNLRDGTLAEAWFGFVPQVRGRTSSNPVFLENCHKCPIVNLCLYCPANASLETGELDGWSEYFCQVAHARADAIQNKRPIRGYP